MLNKNFLSLISSTVAINLGDSFFYITIMWYIHYRYGNPMYTALMGFLFTIPELFSFLFGPIIDKLNKVKLLRLSCFIQMLIVFIVLFASISDNWMIGLFIFFIPIFAIASESSYPTGLALLPVFLRKNDLLKGNAIASFANTGIDLIFNAVAGLLISVVAVQIIFSINLSIFILAFSLTLLLRSNYKKISNSDEEAVIDAEDLFKSSSATETIKEYLYDLLDGFAFIKQKFILKLLLPLLVLNLFFAMMKVNMPLFSDNHFGSALGFGLILSFYAIGTMVGSIIVNVVISKITVGRLIGFCFLFSGTLWILFVFLIDFNFLMSILFLVFSSTFMGMINIIYMTLFQKITPIESLGKVTTFNMSLISAAIPLGSILGGVVTLVFAVNTIFLFYGIGHFILGLYAFCIKQIRSLPKMEQIDAKQVL